MKCMMNEQEKKNPENVNLDEESILCEGDIIELIDENNETVPFVFIDALEYENDVYLALSDPEEDDSVFFLKIEQDQDGNDIYTAPDESLEDKLFKIFITNQEKGLES